MKVFSQRNNYEPEQILQVETLELSTRNLIWNEFYNLREHNIHKFNDLLKFIWTDYLKLPIDELDYCYNGFDVDYDFFKDFILEEDWYKVFDVIEITIKVTDYRFIDKINKILERENSAYRIIDSQITNIIDKNEIETIKEALSTDDSKISIHFKNALEKYSDRVNPDYRNSIKESISAVEYICRKLTKESTLDRALNKLENKGVQINQQLKQGLEKIYFYTNSESGIRHALMDETTLLKKDAKFMLVVCCAFVNYIKESTITD